MAALLRRLRWFNCSVVFLSPLAALYGIATAPHLPARSTLVCAWAYYIFNMLGITAGYHRLWSHRAYSAHPFLQLLLAAAGSGAVQGSIRWWARTHRIHHRYTDTALDPYNAERGLWWTHVGWMLVKSPSFEEKVEAAKAEKEDERVRVARVDVSDLDRNWIVRGQHDHYFVLALIWGAFVPVCLAGLATGHWRDALVWAGLVRLVCVHHCTFAVNSLAHHLGHSPYPHAPPLPPSRSLSAQVSPTSRPHDAPHPHTAFPRPAPTARNHLLTALLTLGEGYHAFHHAFPCDYRCAEDVWGFDPTKWVIAALAGDLGGLKEVLRGLGLWSGAGGANRLRIMDKGGEKARGWTMVTGRQVFEVKEWIGDDGAQKVNESGLDEWTWEEYKAMSRTHPLVVVAGFIHDVRALFPSPYASSEQEGLSSILLSSSYRRPASTKCVHFASQPASAPPVDSTPPAKIPFPEPARINDLKKTYDPPTLPAYLHPGGIPILRAAIGTDATAAFYGGVYEHGWGAHEMLAKMRVAILQNGVEQVNEDHILHERGSGGFPEH